MAVNLLVDPITGDILSVDSTATEFYGYSIGQLGTMNISDIVLGSAEEICAIIRHSRNLQKLSLQIREPSGALCGARAYASMVSIDQAGRLFLCIFEQEKKNSGAVIFDFPGSPPAR